MSAQKQSGHRDHSSPLAGVERAASGPPGQPVSAQMLTHVCTVTYSLPASLPSGSSSHKLFVRSMSSERVSDPPKVTQPGLADSGSLLLYFAQPWEARFGGPSCLEVPECVCIHPSFQPLPAPCPGPRAVLLVLRSCELCSGIGPFLASTRDSDLVPASRSPLPWLLEENCLSRP